jgi:acetyl-CoA carboxylase biotin carboxyl carrier protein
MDLNLIKKLVKIVDTSEITDLEVEENGLRVKIAKKVRDIQAVAQPQLISQSAPTVEQQVTKTPEGEISKTEVQEDMHEVRSPIVGTFYRAPAPDADAYVNVGDEVTQAMKLMNEIESDVNGKVVKILVENGKPVEYNQPLFLIQIS